MLNRNRTGILIGVLASLLIASCAETWHKPDTIDESEFATDFIPMIYDQRTWYPPSKLPFDPIGFAKKVDIPVNDARTKIIGASYQDALDSLAAKLWMIENAEYTVDLVYYIFTRDTAGYAILGALCNAVKRGVDVRIMVDSIGSIHPNHNELRALETCAEEAGFIRDQHGNPTDKKARVQVVIINALSKVFVRMNRRAHDKLIVTDGHVAEKAIVMTGGRNVSVSYYGIHNDGSPDPTAYQDVEIILRPHLERSEEADTVGDVTTYYYTMLFLHSGNRRLRPLSDDEAFEWEGNYYTYVYREERDKAQQSLALVKSLPDIQASLDKMPAYMNEGYRTSWVRLAHELGNLRNPKAVTGVEENLRRNPNSIQTLKDEITGLADPSTRARIVSPYFFMARYYDEEGNEIFDGVKEIHKWLEEHPGASFELITNSVLTSDNFFTQAVIDMDTAPRLLLSPELLEQWLASLEKGEFNPELVESEAWKKMINNPRIKIYETGKLDSVYLGGDKQYGKLHAKYIMFDGYGFVGTTNFDYRSRLFNNEFGFYFKDDEIYNDLNDVFEELKANSYLWGTPEWLEMRKKLMEQEGKKASTTRNQRAIFKFLRGTGLEWLF
jgi:hypothetical protein